MSSRLLADVGLRPACAEDRDHLVAVYAAARADELAAVPWSDEQRAAFVAQQFTAQDTYWHALRPGASFDVVEVDGRPAGRLYVDRTPGEIRIVDIGLLPEYRDRGVGFSLITGILDEAAASGTPVTIHVEQGNRARTLYDRLGFRPIGTTGVYDQLEWRATLTDHEPPEASQR